MLLTRRALIIASLASALSACASVTPAPGPSGNVTAGQLSQGARRANGRPPLRYNSKLEAAARSQVRLMVSKDQLSHNLGTTLRQRVTAAGYEGAVGENLAGGQSTLQQAIDGWLKSSGHRQTLLSTRFVEFGLAAGTVPGKSRYGTYWAMVAGGPFEAWR
jgi:uncharacterized protein YkwD